MRKLSVALLLLLSTVVAACDTTATPAATETPGATATPTPTVENSTPGNPQMLPDIASVVERVAPAVVQIIATVEETNVFGQRIEATSQGSGVFFREDGHILTNNHVVEGATRVEIALMNRDRLVAEIVGTDPETDLAVLKVDPDEVDNLVVAPLGDTDAMRIGEWVIAIGSPLGFEGSVTVGIVSAKGRTLGVDPSAPPLYDLVQTDAVINPGNSGGPLLNLDGEIIGINTAIIRGNVGNNQQAEGIGFAVSTGTARPVSQQLIERGEVVRPRIGVTIQDVTPVNAAELGLSVDEGVLVVGVVDGGPADQAGIEANDVIVQVDDTPVSGTTEMVRLFLTQYDVGDTVTLTIHRDAVTLTFDVELARVE